MARVVLDNLNLVEMERLVVEAALQCSETLSEAAKRLGISVNSLRYRMRKYSLKRGEDSPQKRGKGSPQKRMKGGR